MDYPVLIKQLRKKLLVSQTELAEMLGISFASVNRYENGKSNPTIRVQRKLRDLFKKAGMKVEE